MPLAVILIPYGLLVAIFAAFSMVNLYHLVRFGSLTFTSFFATFLYLAGVVMIVFLTTNLISDVDWFSPILEFSLSPRLGF